MARYDGHASWYDKTLASYGHADRWRTVIAETLGMPDKRGDWCLEVGCGTGLHAGSVRAAGYTPLGVDVSFDQLRLARPRLAASLLGDGSRLPIASGSVTRVLGCFTHTDMDDFPGAVAEAARVLTVGGLLAYVGLHPCFVGTFADRREEQEEQELRLGHGYGDDQVRVDQTGRFSLRSRVGGSNLALTDFLNAFLAQPALRIRSVEEMDTDAQPWRNHSDGRVVPWNIAMRAEKVVASVAKRSPLGAVPDPDRAAAVGSNDAWRTGTDKVAVDRPGRG